MAESGSPSVLEVINWGRAAVKNAIIEAYCEQNGSLVAVAVANAITEAFVEASKILTVL